MSPPSEETFVIDTSKQLEFVYKQPVPIPSYLIAIAAGEVAYKRVGKRTGVWADPKTLPAATWEFEKDMEIFLENAEKVCEHDIAVLFQCILTWLFPRRFYLLTNLATMMCWYCHPVSHSEVSHRQALKLVVRADNSSGATGMENSK